MTKTVALITAFQSLMGSHPTLKTCNQAVEALVPIAVLDSSFVRCEDDHREILIHFDEDLQSIIKFKKLCFKKAKRS